MGRKSLSFFGYKFDDGADGEEARFITIAAVIALLLLAGFLIWVARGVFNTPQVEFFGTVSLQNCFRVMRSDGAHDCGAVDFRNDRYFVVVYPRY